MYSPVSKCVLLVACAFVGLVVTANIPDESSLPKSLLTQQFRSFQPLPLSPPRESMNRMLSHILDLTFEMYKELGASQQDLKELHHKRGVIQSCYFQAISCY